MIYQGPITHVMLFFESLGFRCPERKGVADFLQVGAVASAFTLGSAGLHDRPQGAPNVACSGSVQWFCKCA